MGKASPTERILNYVLVDKTLHFHCALQGYALDNMAGNPRVCFTVVGRTQVKPEAFTTAYESVVVFGQAGLTDETKKVEVLKEFDKKYSPEYQEKGFQTAENSKDKTAVVKIAITHLTGKRKL
jgi:nitroimidazol reductase NimA-like FMN-containing flavoprotein (pyridoxamine 5'-phosphate oxidase superfamily)